MKKTTTLKALVLSMVMVLGFVMPMAAQTDGFFKNNADYINRDAASGNITNQTFGQDPSAGTNVTGGITNQQFGAPLGSGLLIMVAAGAGYAVARRKRARKGMTLLLAAAMLLGMTQCKKNVETITTTHDNGIQISLRIENGTRHHVITNGEPFPGDLGKVEFDDGDVIYVFNGGNLVGVMEYNESDQTFYGTIGIDIMEDEPYPAIPLDPDDYLHFGFFGNAALDADAQGLYADISGQKRNLPVLSVGKTAELYGNYEAQGITDFSCMLENKCALVKFTFNDVAAGIGMDLDDEVVISGVLTQARLDFSNGLAVVPDQSSTGRISLYHASSGDANVRWAVLLQQGAVTGKNMLLRNWLYTGNLDIDATALNEYKEVEVSCSGTTPVQYDIFTSKQGKKVLFSTGNLQYNASTTTWRFAEHQWDYVGGTDSDTISWGNVTGSSNDSIGLPEYEGWIDLFGFGTGDDPTKTSSDLADYATYNDWGENINDGKNWYAPLAAEWLCLINYRPNDDALNMGYQDDIRINKCGPSTVHGVEGYVILPDYFEWPTEYPQSSFTPKTYGDTSGWANYAANTFTDTQWTAMENNGAAFMPAAGLREPGRVYLRPTSSSGWKFFYWTYNPWWSGHNANLLMFGDEPGLYSDRNYDGGSVRLVYELEF